MKSTNYLLNKPIFALIWRFFILAFGLFGITTLCIYSKSSIILAYFTMQSNIFVFVLFLILFIGTLKNIVNKKHETYYLPVWVQFGLIFYVQITFIVYASLLSSSGFTMGSTISVGNILVHYVVPIMALIDWILFMPHGALKIKHSLLWLSYPLAYIGFSFIRAYLGGPFGDGARFPYFFMDADIQGFHLFWICPLFLACFFAFGVVLIMSDSAINKVLTKKSN